MTNLAEITRKDQTNMNPIFEENMGLFQQQVERLELEIGNLEGVREYPDWWYEDTDDNNKIRDLRGQLKTGDIDPQNVSQYFELFSRERQIRAAITGYDNNDALEQFAFENGEDIVGEAFAAEAVAGPLHSAMIMGLEKQVKDPISVPTQYLKVLQKAYGTASMTELIGMGGDEYSDATRKLLLTETVVHWIRYNEEEGILDSELTWQETQEAARSWMGKALELASGVKDKEASDYVFSASRKWGDSSIVDIIGKFDQFGVDRIRKITKFTGIHGLENYSVEQLERMEALVDDPENAANALENHDVTVALVNTFGDYSGVMSHTAENLDDDNKRTLFFEISSFEDIYRKMIALNKIGVKPSTIVLAAHSAPGQFMVSDNREIGVKRRDIATVAGRRLVSMANADTESVAGDKGYSMHGMKGVARLVENYMKPSRAIDDDKADLGRKKIIFQACSAATEVESFEKDANGQGFQIGTESVVSQLGKDIATSGLGTSVDIYGAPSTIQMHRTPHGLRYSGHPVSFDEGRTPLHAVRVRVENGQLSKENVDEIVLRKA